MLFESFSNHAGEHDVKFVWFRYTAIEANRGENDMEKLKNSKNKITQIVMLRI